MNEPSLCVFIVVKLLQVFPPSVLSENWTSSPTMGFPSSDNVPVNCTEKSVDLVELWQERSSVGVSRIGFMLVWELVLGLLLGLV